MKELYRFGVVGCIATFIQYITYYILLSIFVHSIAYSIGYILSFSVNYILTTAYTFKVKRTRKNWIGFVLSHLVNYCLQIGLLSFFVVIGINKTIAPIPVFAICIPTNFILVRFFVKNNIFLK